MDGARLVIRLRERGFKVSVRDGQLFVTENDKLRLTPGDVAQIKQHREEMISYVQDPKLFAIEERAWNDPPNFAVGDAAECGTVIVEAEGFPVMALPKDYVDFIIAWNRLSLERWHKKTAKGSTQRQKVDRQARLNDKEHQ